MSGRQPRRCAPTELLMSQCAVVQGPFMGRVWDSPESLHVPVPSPTEPPAPRMLALGTYFLQKKTNKPYFEQAFDKKHYDIASIPGKNHFGYYFASSQEAPVGFMIWDSDEEKEKGKGALWTIMMENKVGAAKDHSVHMMAEGGMFGRDSLRSYQPCHLAVSDD